MIKPFAPDSPDDAEDCALVARGQEGSRDALEALIGRHQAWIYNIARRMLYHVQDAEDATQEVLIKVVTNLSTFDGRSRFRTWLYRICVNHLLNTKRGMFEEAFEGGFSDYARGLDNTPDRELPDSNAVPADVQLLVSEAMLGCTSGMLLCLDRQQRMTYILGSIFGVPDVVGAELLETSRDNFRQRLARARRDLHSFMHGQCGLVNAANSCRCARKTQGFIEAGYVDPARLIFASERMTRVRDVAGQAYERLEVLDVAYADIHRNQPFHDSPDFVGALRQLMDTPAFKSMMEPRL